MATRKPQGDLGVGDVERFERMRRDQAALFGLTARHAILA